MLEIFSNCDNTNGNSKSGTIMTVYVQNLKFIWLGEDKNIKQHNLEKNIN